MLLEYFFSPWSTSSSISTIKSSDREIILLPRFSLPPGKWYWLEKKSLQLQLLIQKTRFIYISRYVFCRLWWDLFFLHGINSPITDQRDSPNCFFRIFWLFKLFPSKAGNRVYRAHKNEQLCYQLDKRPTTVLWTTL